MWDLNFPHHTGGVHPGSFVYGVAPDVKDRLPRPDHAAHEGPTANAHSQVEIIERVDIHVLETMAHGHRVIHQSAQMLHVIAALILPEFQFFLFEPFLRP